MKILMYIVLALLAIFAAYEGRNAEGMEAIELEITWGVSMLAMIIMNCSGEIADAIKVKD